jgi:hypothetical protein
MSTLLSGVPGMIEQNVQPDFAGEFFLLWFYPVGIWIVQPKINKMVESTPDLPVL